MATITLKYDARNAVVKSILESAIVAGAQVVTPPTAKSKKLNPIEKSLADIKAGRVTRVENIANLLEECMQ